MAPRPPAEAEPFPSRWDFWGSGSLKAIKQNFTSVFLLSSQSCPTSFSLPPRRSEAGESSLNPDPPSPTFIPALGDLVPWTPQLPGLNKSGDTGDPTFFRVTGTGACQGGLECPCPNPLPRIPKFAEHLNLLAKGWHLIPPQGQASSGAGTRPETRSCRDCQAAPNPGRGRLVQSSGLRQWERREAQNPGQKGRGDECGGPAPRGKGAGWS